MKVFKTLGRIRGNLYFSLNKDNYKKAYIGTYLGKDIKISIKELRELPCLRCGQFPIIGEKKDTSGFGHDACIANLPGVVAACCGHGFHNKYIKFENGRMLKDFKMEEI
jgi:hypothetical protein